MASSTIESKIQSITELLEKDKLLRAYNLLNELITELNSKIQENDAGTYY